jgi:hypothetical protein
VLLVGGALRDALLERPPADLDIAVGGDLPGFLDRFAAACGRRPVAIHDAWRETHRTVVAGIQVDVALLLGSVEQDLGKRDFTVNAMALALGGGDASAGDTGQGGGADDARNAAGGRDARSAGRRGGRRGAVGRNGRPALIDPFGGRGDLDARTIRALSAAALDDDPLRMLRAARYVATLDGFEIDGPTRAWIVDRAAAIEEVAGERIQSEWAQLLAGRSWAAGVATAYELGLGARTLVSAGDLEGVAAWEARERRLEAAADAATGRLPESPAAEGCAGAGPVQDRVIDHLAALLADAEVAIAGGVSLVTGTAPASFGEILIDRRWPNAVARRASRIAAWAVDLDGDLPPEDLADRALADREAAARAALLARARAEHRGEAAPPACEKLERLARRAAEKRWVSGAELRAWGVSEGPELGELLEELARGQLQRRWPSAGAARDWARRRAEAMAASSPAAGT